VTRALTTIGFDADDTLWQNEHFFKLTAERFAELLVDYADPAHLGRRSAKQQPPSQGSRHCQP